MQAGSLFSDWLAGEGVCAAVEQAPCYVEGLVGAGLLVMRYEATIPRTPVCACDVSGSRTGVVGVRARGAGVRATAARLGGSG